MCVNCGHVKGNIKQSQMVDCLTCNQDYYGSCYKCCHIFRPLKENHSLTFWKMFLHLVIFSDDFGGMAPSPYLVGTPILVDVASMGFHAHWLHWVMDQFNTT